MAAPMSFFPRVILGATTFTVAVVGAFYLYYKSRYIFRRKPSSDMTFEETVNVDQDCASIALDEPEHRKVNSTSQQLCTDSSVVSLINLLESEDESQLCKLLTTIANKAAFTEGQNAVRYAGGLPAVMRQLERNSDRVRTCTASCIANLSLNNNNQPVLKACIPTLLNLTTDPNHTHGLRLASIQALVNLSVSGQCGEYFSQPAALQRLFTLLEDGSSALGQQALRVLVNLSADGTVTPTLLSYESCVAGIIHVFKYVCTSVFLPLIKILLGSKHEATNYNVALILQVPDRFMDLLESHRTDESLLRTLSFLINLSRGSLTTQVKTVPQTSDACLAFVSLFTLRAGELTVAMDTLMHHGNADVKQQAGRLLVMLSGP